MGTFKDLYIIKWLLQNTEDGVFIWQKINYGHYFTNINSDNNDILVRVELGITQARPMSVIIIKFISAGLGEVIVQEPMKNIFALRKKYDAPDEQELAEIMKKLLSLVVSKHAQKELKDMETENERKQSIFRRLMGIM